MPLRPLCFIIKIIGLAIDTTVEYTENICYYFSLKIDAVWWCEMLDLSWNRIAVILVNRERWQSSTLLVFLLRNYCWSTGLFALSKGFKKSYIIAYVSGNSRALCHDSCQVCLLVIFKLRLLISAFPLFIHGNVYLFFEWLETLHKLFVVKVAKIFNTSKN